MKFEKSDIWQSAVVALIGWILFTIYTLNGRVSTQGAELGSLGQQVNNVQLTVNGIYDTIISKSNLTEAN